MALERTEQSDPDKIIDIGGPPKESLFWQAKLWIIQGKIADLQRSLDDLLEHYKEVDDDRLLAIVCCLCVEQALDLLLMGFMPSYDRLRKSHDFTFWLRIELTRALALLPKRILASVDLIRKIRNAFAHDLDITSFSEISMTLRNKLFPHVRDFCPWYLDESDYATLLRDLTGYCVLSLLTYAYHCERLREYLITDEFRQHFKNFAEHASRSHPEPGDS